MKCLFFGGLLIFITIPMAASKIGFHVAYAHKNHAVVVSFLPTDLEVTQIKGIPLVPGEDIRCKLTAEPLGTTTLSNQPTKVMQAHLVCTGGRDFIIQGVSFEEAR